MAADFSIALYGSDGGFSSDVLELLIERSVKVVAVVLPVVQIPKSDPRFSIVHRPIAGRLISIAEQKGIPVVTADDVQAISGFTIDLGLVACFPQKLRSETIAIAGLGCWNIHPSLLPKYRGPVPLYWQIHHAEKQTGITLHEVCEQMDAGPIVAMRQIALPLETESLNQWVAQYGVELFLASLEKLANGTLVLEPQDESAASYFPFPDRSTEV